MEKDDKGSTMIRMGVSGWMFILVPAYPGCPGSKAVKRLLLLLLYSAMLALYSTDAVAKALLCHWRHCHYDVSITFVTAAVTILTVL